MYSILVVFPLFHPAGSHDPVDIRENRRGFQWKISVAWQLVKDLPQEIIELYEGVEQSVTSSMISNSLKNAEENKK